MTGDTKNTDEKTLTGDELLRRMKIQGEIEIAASEIEQRYDLFPSELAITMFRTQMDRVMRHEGPEGYFRLVTLAIDILTEQKEGIERILREENHRFLN